MPAAETRKVMRFDTVFEPGRGTIAVFALFELKEGKPFSARDAYRALAEELHRLSEKKP